MTTMSLPSWERGLKSCGYAISLNSADVAPLVGAWIEISGNCYLLTADNVAPLVGAWIEISGNFYLLTADNSRSPRGSVD